MIHTKLSETEEITQKFSRKSKFYFFTEIVEGKLQFACTFRLIERFPNYYTLSKALAEDLVSKYKEKFPIAIARPSIVSASVKEPVPGWIEGINGPTGLMLAIGKGILRSYYCDPTSNVEAIPVDLACNAMIAIGCKRAMTKGSNMLIYNLSTAGIILNQNL